MRVYVETYGCWLNKADSMIMITLLLRRGYNIVTRVEDADIVILNTCAVRGDSEIRQLKRMRELYRKYPDKIYIIAGCLAKVRVSEIRKIFEGKCIIVGPNDVENIDNIIDVALREERKIFLSDDRPMKVLPDYIPELMMHVHVVPLQVGCLCSCTFCVTKYARDVKGKVKSYPIDLIIENVKKAIERGAREIYLTGQDVACYGFDRGYTLVDLLEKLLSSIDRDDIFIRIGMSEPEAFSKIADQLIDIVKRDRRVYKYFHLPVQSGSDKILRLMRRKYTVDEYRELVRKIRREIPNATIVTDMIVGFPGETEEDFELSLKLIRELEFDKVHVARFSPRPFTEAEVMENQVPDSVKKMRSRRMVEIANEVSLKRNLMYIGGRFRGIVSSLDQKGQGVVVRLENYKPTIVKNVDDSLISAIVEVNIRDATPINLIGDIDKVIIEPVKIFRRVQICEELVEDAS